ncbi:iron-siderophore ABC transporter substrate-binding protein [Martelella endophytica]|uniref:iron-siderophore ABC transporter substrate-binding protein n=1 Tax=Martelella endophytica TaxID=1486262 RepID=UPI001FCD7255|nr:iron-siderophore ABC transporter substrate-binding protein [Martelella endophytica]
MPARAAAPKRIACLDYAGASTLLALGITPIAVASLDGWAKWVGKPQMPEGVADLGSSWEISFEVLAALQPDLILTSPFLAHLTPRLEHYAPVLSLDVYTAEDGPVLTRAIAATRRLGQAIGREEAATAFLQQADRMFEDCAATLGGSETPPVAIISFLDERHVRIYSAPGLYDSVLERLGVANAWPGAANVWGYETIAIADLARIADPKTALVVIEPLAADILPSLERSPLWRALPFTARERLVVIPPVLLFGMVNEATRFARLFTTAMAERA